MNCPVLFQIGLAETKHKAMIYRRVCFNVQKERNISSDYNSPPLAPKSVYFLESPCTGGDFPRNMPLFLLFQPNLFKTKTTTDIVDLDSIKIYAIVNTFMEYNMARNKTSTSLIHYVYSGPVLKQCYPDIKLLKMSIIFF